MIRSALAILALVALSLLHPAGALAQGSPAAAPGWDLEVPLGAPTDDAEEFLAPSRNRPDQWPEGFAYTHSSDLELGADPSQAPQVVGLRFPEVEIPAGATVEAAALRFTADASTAEPVRLSFRGLAGPEPETFRDDEPTQGGRGVSGRPTTDAVVSWEPEPWEAGRTYLSPDLATVLQEIVDAPGWTGAGPVGFVVRAEEAGPSARRSAVSYDASAEGAPVLLVRFAVAADADAATEPPAPAEEAPDEREPVEETPAETPPVEEAPAPEAAPERDEPEGPAGAAPPAEPRRLRFPLEPQGARGVGGSVLLTDYGAGRTILSVAVRGGRPGAAYAATVGRGTCGARSAVVAELEPIESRTGLSTTVIEGSLLEALRAEPHHVALVVDAGGMVAVVACAELDRGPAARGAEGGLHAPVTSGPASPAAPRWREAGLRAVF